VRGGALGNGPTVVVTQSSAFRHRIEAYPTQASEFHLALFRAGHTHAAVLLILALLAQIFAGAADFDGALMAKPACSQIMITKPAGPDGQRRRELPPVAGMGLVAELRLGDHDSRLRRVDHGSVRTQ
jgi:hypothetical protein